MAKINKWSLTELVTHGQRFKSLGDFVAQHSNPISGQNGFLIKQGSVDDKAIPATRISRPHFSTAPGDIDAKYVASVFSPKSIVYEILWDMCLNPVVDKSVGIFVGRGRNNTIVLEDQYVSKLQGFFILVKRGNSLRVLYREDEVKTRGKVKRPDEPTAHDTRYGEYTFIPSRSEISMGQSAFTFYSAEDVYNRVLKILKK